MSTKQSHFHIALDGQGYLLADTPEKPRRVMDRAPIFGNRFASGDRDYTDFSLWWFWAQTDWSGGVKNDWTWEDDAKFFYSTNIDAFSKIGSIKLAYDVEADNTFTENIQCGGYGTLAGSNYRFVGTDDNAANRPVIYRSTTGAWTDISGANIGATQNAISRLLCHKNCLYYTSLGIGGSDVVQKYDGSSWTDCSEAISAGSSHISSIQSARCMAEIGEDLYVEAENWSNDHVSISKTSDNGATFTEVVYHNTDGHIQDMVEYDGDLYYLLYLSGAFYLRKYDVSASVDSLVKRFSNVSGTGPKLLFPMYGKLIITIPQKEIWEWNGSTMTQLWERDSDKYAVSYKETSPFLSRGVIKGDRIFWANFIYDGTNFYNNIKPADDLTDYWLYPLLVDSNDRINWSVTDHQDIIYKDSADYKSAIDKNFLVFSEISEVSTIDKLANSIRIVFDKFESGEEIELHYSIDGGDTYTELGSASRTVDGGTVTQKTFYIGDDINFRKMIVKVFLNGDGTSTPELKDISLQYIPIPDYRYQWSFTINCNNEIVLTDGRTLHTLKGIDLRNKLRTSFLQREIIELEDIDYHETQLNGSIDDDDTTITVDSTDGFPESGRIKIEDEEIFYNGKTAVQFSNCVRKYRGTTADDHADDTAVDNKYKVLILDYKETNKVIADSNTEEFLVNVSLLEA